MKVKLSAHFLRSIGGSDPHADSLGIIERVEDGWLAHVRFGGDIRKINVGNLVRLEDVDAEAREAEQLPGVTIGPTSRTGIFHRPDPHHERKYLIKECP